MPLKVERPPHVALDGQGRLANERPCVGCGYNLRGQSTRGSCLECGLPVRRSLTGLALRHCDLPWLRRLRRGWILISIAAVLAAVDFAAGIVAGTDVAETIWMILPLDAILASVLLAGVWLFMSPDPSMLRQDQMLAVTTRGLAFGYLGLVLLTGLFWQKIGLLTAATGGWFGWVVMWPILRIALALLFLQRSYYLALRVPDKAQVHLARILQAGCLVIIVGTAALMGLAAVEDQQRRLGVGGDSLRGVIAVVGWLLLLSLVLVVYLMIMQIPGFQRMLRREVSKAEEYWLTVAPVPANPTRPKASPPDMAEEDAP